MWVLVGGTTPQWWEQVMSHDVTNEGCSAEQLALTLDGAFSVVSLEGLLDGGRSVAGMVSHVSSLYHGDGRSRVIVISW